MHRALAVLVLTASWLAARPARADPIDAICSAGEGRGGFGLVVTHDGDDLVGVGVLGPDGVVIASLDAGTIHVRGNVVTVRAWDTLHPRSRVRLRFRATSGRGRATVNVQGLRATRAVTCN